MKKLLIAFLLAFSFTSFVPVVHAQAFQEVTQGLKRTGSAAKFNTAVTETTLASAIGNIVQVVLGLLGIIFLLLIIYAGFVWLIAAGDEGRVTRAKNTLINAVVGLAIVLAAYSISTFVFNALESSVSAPPASSGSGSGGQQGSNP